MFKSDLYLLYPTAAGPGLVYWDGMVGHSGKNGCRLYCGLLSCRKMHGHHYYLALIKPRDRCATGSDHPDVNMFDLPSGGSERYADNLRRLIASPNQTQYEQRKTETGITKAPLILGLRPSHSLGVPYCMTTDIMHLASNISDLLISLWRGTIDCDQNDNFDDWDWAVLADDRTWITYGASVHAAGFHLPGMFGVRPRNIAEKLSSGYKTWEFQLHTFGLGPILLYNILPNKYFKNYCKLVRGFQIMCQHRITTEDLIIAQSLLCQWKRGLEDLYYHYQESRLHFIRPCVHQVSHLADETVRKGPSICYAQWTMERTIGNLGQEIRQSSHPFANLAQEGVHHCCINGLLTAIPELGPPPQGFPDSAIDLENGYILLPKRDHSFVTPANKESQALQQFLGTEPGSIKQWARLRLKNGQVA